MWLLRKQTKKKSMFLKQSVWKKNRRICRYQLNLFPGFSSLLYWIVLKMYWIQTIFSEGITFVLATLGRTPDCSVSSLRK